MTSRFAEIVIVCHDPRHLGRLWCGVHGYQISDNWETGVEISGMETGPERSAPRPQPPTLVFVQVAQGKPVKNRLHIDVNPVDSDQDKEGVGCYPREHLGAQQPA